MRWLRKIPFWGWFLITLVIAYGTWNPWGFSLVGMWISGVAISTPVKVLITLIVGAAIYLLITETFRSLGHLGLIIYLAIVGVVIWALQDFGFLTAENIATAQWWAQIPIAFGLTLGSQASKIYRAMTGRVGVDDPDTVAHDHE